jgi:hypothetical protein
VDDDDSFMMMSIVIVSAAKLKLATPSNTKHDDMLQHTTPLLDQRWCLELLLFLF